MPSAVLNLEHLRLITDGDPALERELMRLFFASARDCLARLQQLAERDEGNEWALVVHELKGMAANVRAEQMADLCGEAQQAGKTERMAAYAALAEAYGRLRSFPLAPK